MPCTADVTVAMSFCLVYLFRFSMVDYLSYSDFFAAIANQFTQFSIENMESSFTASENKRKYRKFISKIINLILSFSLFRWKSHEFTFNYVTTCWVFLELFDVKLMRIQPANGNEIMGDLGALWTLIVLTYASTHINGMAITTNKKSNCSNRLKRSAQFLFCFEFRFE